MKKLTPEEIDFIRKTGITPTVIQCDEYEKRTNKPPYYIHNFAEALDVARNDFNIDLPLLLQKIDDPEKSDGITLEYDAAYLFYIFFSSQDLIDIDPYYALDWLEDFKYYNGYRKWDLQLVEIEIQEALELHSGSRILLEDSDGDIWHKEKEEIEDPSNDATN